MHTLCPILKCAVNHMNSAVHKEEFVWHYIFHMEYFKLPIITMTRTYQNPLTGRILIFFCYLPIRIIKLSIATVLGGHLVCPHAESRPGFAIRWSIPRPSLVKLCNSLRAGMLQSLSVFLCSTAPCDKNFLPSFKRQVRKHLFPVFQKKV